MSCNAKSLSAIFASNHFQYVSKFIYIINLWYYFTTVLNLTYCKPKSNEIVIENWDLKFNAHHFSVSNCGSLSYFRNDFISKMILGNVQNHFVICLFVYLERDKWQKRKKKLDHDDLSTLSADYCQKMIITGIFKWQTP